jgi:capsular exopolysaccharide synthesis family protein
LIGAGAVALAERLDRRLHDPLDLERLTGTPLLAHVPASAFPGSAPDPQLPIVFQTLRDGLTYFNLDRPLTSLLLMSPLKGDGKTSVATQLAVAYARAGKRVILVDADLRSPQVARRMGAERAPGLTELLTGGVSSHEALQEIEPFGTYLRVLAGGSIPPNPSEMLGSARMSTVLAELSEQCDLVLIDTPPVLVVSDAFPLFDQVVGIVGVARLDRTERDPIKRAVEVTVNAGGRVLGMVATGGKGGETYGYAYASAYGEPPAAAAAELAPAAEANGGRARRLFRSG